MDVTALFQDKKFLTILLILTIPLWLPTLNDIIDLVFEAGQILGSCIRFIASGNYCTF